jgi:hypothetical protein
MICNVSESEKLLPGVIDEEEDMYLRYLQTLSIDFLSSTLSIDFLSSLNHPSKSNSAD